MTTTNMQTTHWHYYHGEPTVTGKLKQSPEDFQVKELLTFEPLGEGEHIYLYVRKVLLNTAFVAEQLAKFTGVPLRNVSYAGRKDKYAQAEQWFCVHLPGKAEPDWQSFHLDGLTLLRIERHHKKLRTGNLDANHFQITLRNVDQPELLTPRLQSIKAHGVPNYFGTQRFGELRISALSGNEPSGNEQAQTGGNLALAELMLQGETIRNRNKRSMAISALRSWLFNQFVHERLSDNDKNNRKISEAIHGDVLILSGSNSFFNCEAPDAMIQTRLRDQDISLSAPLWGAGELASTKRARELEQAIADRWPQQCRLLEELGLKQERRALWLHPAKLQWQFQDNALILDFFLSSGSYATSVIRELIKPI